MALETLDGDGDGDQTQPIFFTKLNCFKAWTEYFQEGYPLLRKMS